MEGPGLALAALAALPAAWLALVFADRIPDAHPLFRPFPSAPFPRGMSMADASLYPLTALLFVLGGLRFDEPGYLLAYLGLFTVLIALSIIDIATLRLPDRLVFPSIGVTLVVICGACIADRSTGQLQSALAGALLYFGVLFLAHVVYPAGMGFGDVKMAFLMGLFLGWPTTGGVDVVVVVMWAMLAGFGLGSILGIGILIFRGRSSPYPFGPFLALGAVIVMLVTPDLVPVSTSLRF